MVHCVHIAMAVNIGQSFKFVCRFLQ